MGYLGTELCIIYSGESWYNQIIAIDNNFFSKRVAQLRKWNIEFHQVDIRDKKKIHEICHDADAIHHLAGITNVAYTKSESNSALDRLIKDVAINGTNNILNSINLEKCKFIFPSTHVVFEGIKKNTKNISELEKPKPILSYSTSKYCNELDIVKNSKNYTILRLGSVYGFSEDGCRIQIMPNLFSKLAATNQNIQIYQNGIQLKSLVNLIDVVRCFQFVEKNPKIKNETFHLVNENVTVKKVSQICKKYQKKLRVISVKKEIPNIGYSLSNNKLKKTGFKFLYTLDASIKEMINKWSTQPKYPNEYSQNGEREFVDKRGKISNFDLPEPINLIGLISSKKYTGRANHYHPVQEQKCLVVKGEFISLNQNLFGDKLKSTKIIKEGQLVVTKPNVAHTMIFSKDTIFLNLVRGERDHENYGITHTIPLPLIDYKQAKEFVEQYEFNCRVCNNNNFYRVLNLGFLPLANNLLKTRKEKFQEYPLELNYCKNCSNAQLSFSVNNKKLFKNYLYLSSTSNT